MLGEIPGFVNVGELIDLFRREASRARRCGCGRPFAECDFWAGAAHARAREKRSAARQAQVRARLSTEHLGRRIRDLAQCLADASLIAVRLGRQTFGV